VRVRRRQPAKTNLAIDSPTTATERRRSGESFPLDPRKERELLLVKDGTTGRFAMEIMSHRGRKRRKTRVYEAFLGLGSNLGDKAGKLEQARRKLEEAGVHLERVSPVYLTEPVDFKEQDWFLNQVLWVSTALDPMQLLQVCLKIEGEMGRERRVAKGPRSIDIDVLLYQGLVLRSQALTIPHPRLHLRRFVLQALAALAPELIHPVLQKPMIELLLGCSDTAQVRQLEDRAP
jgi:2-amino-4-hydroxy-6-hydroxymethyldihydropteridine diphosphokinase